MCNDQGLDGDNFYCAPLGALGHWFVPLKAKDPGTHEKAPFGGQNEVVL
jgi:hypothetical protein